MSALLAVVMLPVVILVKVNNVSCDAGGLSDAARACSASYNGFSNVYNMLYLRTQFSPLVAHLSEMHHNFSS